MRAGRDVTILCYSRMRYVVMQAVAELEKAGYDPEVRCRLTSTYTRSVAHMQHALEMLKPHS